MFHFMNFVRPFVNYAIFRELCDRMRFEVDCAKSHHRVISEGLHCPHILRISRHYSYFLLLMLISTGIFCVVQNYAEKAELSK